MINAQASGFLYYISITGITGTDAADIEQVKEKLTIIKEISDLPIAVGFGIQNAEQAAKISQYADLIVVGSAFCKIIQQQQNKKAVLLNNIKDLAKKLKARIN